MARLDPLTDQEVERILAAVDELRWKHGDAVDPRYKTVIRALRYLGCHPIVLAQPTACGLELRSEPNLCFAVWHRPKTKRLMRVPFPPEFMSEMEAYLARPYSVAQIRRIVNEAAKRAGLAGVGPRTFRHTKGYNEFSRRGADAAQKSLGVSERVLRAYMALTDRRLLEEQAKDFATGGPA